MGCVLESDFAAVIAKEASEGQTRADAQAQFERLPLAALDDNLGEVASFALMVYKLPNSRLELDYKPPDKLFRKWKVNAGSTSEVYTLVGGFVDGKWVVYSNLVARR